MSSQASDASMGEEYTDSQVEGALKAVLATDPTNDRIEDGLATGQVNAQRSQDNKVDTGDNKLEEASSEEASFEEGTGDLDSLMAAGGALISRFASSQQSLASDGDFEGDCIREDFGKIKSSTWMQKKIDGKTAELDKLVKQHDATKKELVAPVKELMQLYPEKKNALVVMAGLLDEACTDADLRDAIISSAGTLKYQIKIVENISANMKVIEVGGVCLEEKKAEEAKKRGSSSSTLSAAASLVHGVSASKKQRK